MVEEVTKFRAVLLAAQEKYESKIPKYGESWKECPTHFLMKRLLGEVEEFKEAKDFEAEYQELLDIINQACMLADRLH